MDILDPETQDRLGVAAAIIGIGLALAAGLCVVVILARVALS